MKSTSLCFVAASFLVASLLFSLASADQWSLAGHGVSRSLYNGTSSSFTTVLNAKTADSCTFPSYSTPFSWWTYDAGAIMSDSGMIYVTLYCKGQLAGNIWAINANTGAQAAFEPVNVSTFDSYLRFLPDGTLIAGVNGVQVNMFDPTTLETIGTTKGLNRGYGGAMVLALMKPVGSTQQVISAGGDGGSNWWGGSCNVQNGHDLSKCIKTADSTVCIGADGMSAYNNQRYESPNGAVRFTLPFPAKPVPFNTNYVSWPWWIRSDLAGNVYVYDGEFLTKYDMNEKQLWQMTYPYFMGLMITDDESTVILSNDTYIMTLSPQTGDEIFTLSYVESFKENVECATVISPWQNSIPIPLADSSNMIVICASSETSFFAAVVDLQDQSVSGKTALTVPPAQVIVDNTGNLYSIGLVKSKPTIQKIEWSALSGSAN